MTYVKKLLVIVTLVLSLCAVSVFATGCGSAYNVKAGEYTGKYTCTYNDKDGNLVHAGYIVKFSVDEKGMLWTLTTSAPAADWEGAASDATYTTPALGQRPWDGGKILGQFDDEWSVDDFMKIKVNVDKNGCPSGEKPIESDKTLTVGVGYEVGTGIVILAVQNAIKAAA